MLSLVFLLGVFPVLVFYIGVKFEQAVQLSDGEALAANYVNSPRAADNQGALDFYRGENSPR